MECRAPSIALVPSDPLTAGIGTIPDTRAVVVGVGVETSDSLLVIPDQPIQGDGYVRVVAQLEGR